MLLDWLQRLIVNGWILAGLFGALVYLAVAGPGPLDVTNTGWIFEQTDITGAYMGWSFYRDAPWSAAIADNPLYGMDFSGSILFSDAIPLMAIPFKALSPMLPEQFQYFGLWTFLNFVLQGVFGWLLMSRATDNALARILGAILISLTPLYIYRLVYPECTHMSLTAHWLVLGALYLCLPPHTRRPWLWWGLLLAAVAFVHAYLFCMVAALWLADLVRRGFLDFRKTWIEPLGIALTVGGLVWVTGVWSGPAGEMDGGFGWFKMNLLGLIDPSSRPTSNWSYVVPDMPNWGGDYEGYAFVGLGGLILAGVAAWALPGIRKQLSLSILLPYWPFAMALLGMAIFSVSRNATLGTVNFYLPWPGFLHYLGELFRSTGRFIWPLYYALFFVGVLIASRRLPARTLCMILAGAAIVQAIDTSRGWTSDGAYLRQPSSTFQTALVSPFWDQAETRYDAVRLAPYKNMDPRFPEVTTMARAHGMTTDAAYLARIRTTAAKDSRARIERGIATGEWPQDTLFVLDEPIARRILETNDPTKNFVGRVDGMLVLAPGWTGCSDCGAVSLASP
ncbi:MAG: DUF6311 domain-containing protein [Hyphomonadaceae bacterium]